ncbi:hypothetical protein [Nannocystis exedens]|uniref:hypothetical protein n=1 Tax=Nannocystis exedens TaxID=54 RepID=UPI000BBA00FD
MPPWLSHHSFCACVWSSEIPSDLTPSSSLTLKYAVHSGGSSSSWRSVTTGGAPSPLWSFHTHARLSGTDVSTTCRWR